MNARLYGVVLSARLSGCVVMPEGPLKTSNYEPRGIPLAATESVVVFVSTEIAPMAPLKGGDRLPLTSPRSVTDRFLKGFRAVRQDANIELGDEFLRETCFEKGTKSVLGEGRPVLVMPSLDAPDCRALVEARGIRYLISVSGSRLIFPVTGEPVQMSVFAQQEHQFEVIARAVDAKSGAVVCEERSVEYATWHGGVIWLYIPVPYFQFMDDSAHWERAGWYTGNKVGGCFVQPGEKK
jgi:hypothetical protein